MGRRITDWIVCAPAVADARIFRVTIRVLNRTATDELCSRSGPEYRDFSRQLLREVKAERRRGAPWGRLSETPARSSSGALSLCLRRRSPDPALITGRGAPCHGHWIWVWGSCRWNHALVHMGPCWCVPSLRGPWVLICLLVLEPLLGGGIHQEPRPPSLPVPPRGQRHTGREHQASSQRCLPLGDGPIRQQRDLLRSREL